MCFLNQCGAKKPSWIGFFEAEYHNVMLSSIFNLSVFVIDIKNLAELFILQLNKDFFCFYYIN